VIQRILQRLRALLGRGSAPQAEQPAEFPETLAGETVDVTADEEGPRELTRTVVRGVGIAGLGYVGAQAITLGFYLALARLATPSDFGELAAGSLVVGLGMMVSESGMMAAVIHERERVEEAASTATLATLAGGLALTLLALALAPLIGLFFRSDTIGAVGAVMSGTILLRTLDVAPSAMMQRRFAFTRRTVVEPLSAAAFGIGAVIGTANGMGVWGLVIGHYAGGFTALVLSWGLARWRPDLGLASFEKWKGMARYGRHVLAAVVVLRIGEQADTIWLGRFLGTAPLGQYRYAFRLASTPFLALLAAGSYVLFPAFARIATDMERFERAFLRSLRWMCLVGFPAGLIMVPLGVPLAVTLFGDIWRPAGVAAAFMCLFCGGSCISSMASEAIKAHGHTATLTRLNTVITVTTVVSMGALLAPFGLNGVAAGVSVGAIVGGAYAMRAVRSTVGFTLPEARAEILGPAAAAALMAAAVFPLEKYVFQASEHTTIAALALIAAEALIALIVFLAALRPLAPRSFSELTGAASRGRRELAAIRARRSAAQPTGPEG
jgi:O-antigen/teichoic acid export membrane protein